jgi:hypothetical protein
MEKQKINFTCESITTNTLNATLVETIATTAPFTASSLFRLLLLVIRNNGGNPLDPQHIAFSFSEN